MASLGQKKGVQGGKKKQVSLVLLLALWVVGCPLLWFFYPSVTLIVVGMSPTLLSGLAETNPGRPRTLCMGGFNICGVLPYLLDLWANHQSMAMVLKIFMDPDAVITMLGCSVVGYFIYWSIPQIVIATLRISARKRIRFLKRTQDTLLKEWGEDIRPEKRKAEADFLAEEKENQRRQQEMIQIVEDAEDEDILADVGPQRAHEKGEDD